MAAAAALAAFDRSEGGVCWEDAASWETTSLCDGDEDSEWYDGPNGESLGPWVPPADIPTSTISGFKPQCKSRLCPPCTGAPQVPVGSAEGEIATSLVVGREAAREALQQLSMSVEPSFPAQGWEVVARDAITNSRVFVLLVQSMSDPTGAVDIYVRVLGAGGGDFPERAPSELANMVIERTRLIALGQRPFGFRSSGRALPGLTPNFPDPAGLLEDAQPYCPPLPPQVTAPPRPGRACPCKCRSVPAVGGSRLAATARRQGWSGRGPVYAAPSSAC